MRKIQISLSFLLLLIVSLFYTQPYLLAAVATIDINSVSDCNCLFDEALKDGDWEKAAVSAKQIIATEPNSVKAQDAYLWLGLYNKSKYDFSKSTEY
jgi:TolA-binding protein